MHSQGFLKVKSEAEAKVRVMPREKKLFSSCSMEDRRWAMGGGPPLEAGKCKERDFPLDSRMEYSPADTIILSKSIKSWVALLTDEIVRSHMQVILSHLVRNTLL